MTTATRVFFVPALLLSASALCAIPRPQLRATETIALRSAADPTLESMRAGARPANIGLRVDERAQLRAAAEQSRGIEALRGGELNLSDRDLKLILIAAVVTALLIIIL